MALAGVAMAHTLPERKHHQERRNSRVPKKKNQPTNSPPRPVLRATPVKVPAATNEPGTAKEHKAHQDSCHRAANERFRLPGSQCDAWVGKSIRKG